MAAISTEEVPSHLDGPALVAAAAGLMLLPSNASRHVRLHRLAALGMALPDHGARAASPSAIRSMLKRGDIGGPRIQMMEDPYSEPLVYSLSFDGGPYLVSGGSGEHAVADLELIAEAIFQDDLLPKSFRASARQLLRGLLLVSDLVLRRAALARGTAPTGWPGTPVEVPGASLLATLVDATFISHEDLAAYGPWLTTVVDTFALDPGELSDPCGTDYTDDRLQVTPFLRLDNGYRVVLPLDLSITVRFHLLRFAKQDGLLAELGSRWRERVVARLRRLLPGATPFEEIARSRRASRYLAKIDSARDLHVIVATDPLVDWQPDVWGYYDTDAVLNEIAELIEPSAVEGYSSADEVVHLVLTDSPGRAAFWGVPYIEHAAPVLMARSDDLDVIFHEEQPDVLVGLLLFAQAVERRAGQSMATDILDEYAIYAANHKSFYLSDGAPPHFTVFQVGDGVNLRMKYLSETDRHGVVMQLPGTPIVQVQRRYATDAPEIFITMPNSSFLGCVVESEEQTFLIRVDLGDGDFIGVEPDLLDCVAFWVRECTTLANVHSSRDQTELVLQVRDVDSWKRISGGGTSGAGVTVVGREGGYNIALDAAFARSLQEALNTGERLMVHALLAEVFGVPAVDLESTLDMVAPLGPKRMVTIFTQDGSPDMLATRLPRALLGHEQVEAQVLDELGEWLRLPSGGAYQIGELTGRDRVEVLRIAVAHLFNNLEQAIAPFEKRALLEFLILQSEALLHRGRVTSLMLPSRLACFGEQSETVADLVKDRKEMSSAHRATRFLIEYVAATPPPGDRSITTLDHYHLLALAKEIIDRATTSDFLHYELADFEISILESGRLGTSRDERVVSAMDAYATNAGTQTLHDALRRSAEAPETARDGLQVIEQSESAMIAEFGFTLSELREVCGGLLDLGNADTTTRVDRAAAVSQVASSRALDETTVSKVLHAISLEERSSFLEIGSDAWPWRFNRDKSYVRRPIVVQGDQMVYGFRSVYRLGLYWIEGLLSGRWQGKAATTEMQQFISIIRRRVNDDFARSVQARFRELGFITRLGVKKVGKVRIADGAGRDLGDIDVLAVHTGSRTIMGVEAKDFEIARTPAEIANELEKLFVGSRTKKSTIDLHSVRVAWLKGHVGEVLETLGIPGSSDGWVVRGIVVTSEPLLSPLVRSSQLPVIAANRLSLQGVGLGTQPRDRSVGKDNRRRRR